MKYNDNTKENKLENGIVNLGAHIENLKKSNSNIVVCLNKYSTDKEEEIEQVKNYCKKYNISFAVSTAYINGGSGAIDLAQEVIKTIEEKNNFRYLYDIDTSIKEKIEIIAHEIYRASKVEYSELAMKKINDLEGKNISKLPICVAKTQYSLSDDKNKLGLPKNYILHVKDIRLYNGAEFITVLLGDIMTMPGLPKKPNYEQIKLDNNNKIVGIF